jgi:hypothetical protein
MKRILVLLCLVLLAPIGVEAIEVRTGILIHDVAPLFGVTKVEGGVDLNGEFIFGKGFFRPLVGMSINSQMDTSCVYSGGACSLVSNRGFLDFGVGVAAHVNSKRALGSTFLFRLSVEIGYMWGRHGVSILFDHQSNGAGFFWWDIPNAGIDSLGIRYVFKDDS